MVVRLCLSFCVVDAGIYIPIKAFVYIPIMAYVCIPIMVYVCIPILTHVYIPIKAYDKGSCKDTCVCIYDMNADI